MNTPGSYLFEPAGSVHTLQAAHDTDGPTVSWFAIWGANVNVDKDRKVTAVIDAYTI
ncbi:hypothetical protein BF49_3804 [Bradyrhizobium sp.]|nr:hypothetical protein BF49_3804 [Bradyrhizobium sp.]